MITTVIITLDILSMSFIVLRTILFTKNMWITFIQLFLYKIILFIIHASAKSLQLIHRKRQK